jgi:hypothetical protein
MNELFPTDAGAQDSPKLAWIKKHDVVTERSDALRAKEQPWCAVFRETKGDDFFSAMSSVLAHWGDDAIGYGETEEAAIVDLAAKHDIPLWNEEAAT